MGCYPDAHLSDLEDKLVDAELAAHDGSLDPLMGWMHTRIAAAKTKFEELRRVVRESARAMAEAEGGFNKDQIDMARMLAARGKEGDG